MAAPTIVRSGTFATTVDVTGGRTLFLFNAGSVPTCSDPSVLLRQSATNMSIWDVSEGATGNIAFAVANPRSYVLVNLPLLSAGATGALSSTTADMGTATAAASAGTYAVSLWCAAAGSLTWGTAAGWTDLKRDNSTDQQLVMFQPYSAGAITSPIMTRTTTSLADEAVGIVTVTDAPTTPAGAPVVQSRGKGIVSTNALSHPVTLPSGVAVGDLLIVVMSTDGIPTISFTSGWTQLGVLTGTSQPTGVVLWKVATGSDALTVTTSANEQSSHVSFRISGASGVYGASATGVSTNANPPSYTHGDTSVTNNLWITAICEDGTIVASAAPTTPAAFANLVTYQGAGQGASTNTAEAYYTGYAMDPGTFTSNSGTWVAWTLCVTPGGGGAPVAAVPRHVRISSTAAVQRSFSR